MDNPETRASLDTRHRTTTTNKQTNKQTHNAESYLDEQQNNNQIKTEG